MRSPRRYLLFWVLAVRPFAHSSPYPDIVSISAASSANSPPDGSFLPENHRQTFPRQLPNTYVPPPSFPVSEESLLAKTNRINQQTFYTHYIAHSQNAIIEYPETGSTDGQSVLHMIPINPQDYITPLSNAQYSFGVSHGSSTTHMRIGDQEVECKRTSGICQFLQFLLVAPTAHPDLLLIAGRGLKICEMTPESVWSRPHHIASYEALATERELIRDISTPPSHLHPQRDVCEKTAAFAHTLQLYGCAYSPPPSVLDNPPPDHEDTTQATSNPATNDIDESDALAYEDDESGGESEEGSDDEDEDLTLGSQEVAERRIVRTARSRKRRECKGKVLFEFDVNKTPRIR